MEKEMNAKYPKTKKMVIVKGRGTAREKRIETNIAMYLVTRNGRAVLDLNGEPIYVTVPQD